MYALRPSYGAAVTVKDAPHAYTYDPETKEAKLIEYDGKAITPRTLTPGGPGYNRVVAAYQAATMFSGAGFESVIDPGGLFGGKKKLTEQTWFWAVALGGGALALGLLIVAMSGGKKED